MTRHDGPGAGSRPGYPSSIVYRPSSLVWSWLILVALILLVPLCLGLTALGARRVDVFHAAFFDDCTNHAHQIHWQNPRRYPHDLSNDFITSTRSFVLIEIWIADWPTIRFSRIISSLCPM